MPRIVLSADERRVWVGQPSRPRKVELRPFPTSRRVVTHALRAGRRITPVHGLISVDITEARRRLESAQPPLSLTAFLVASVGRAAAAHPEVHAYRNWRGQLVLHHHVDIATMVEVHTPEGSFPLAHLIRDADLRDVNDISTEIRRVKNDPTSSRSGQLLARVTSVGMFAGGGGFGIGFPTVLTLGVLVGGLSERPRVIGGRVEVREVLDLT